MHQGAVLELQLGKGDRMVDLDLVTEISILKQRYTIKRSIHGFGVPCVHNGTPSVLNGSAIMDTSHTKAMY